MAAPTTAEPMVALMTAPTIPPLSLRTTRRRDVGN
jgi:hypothetical protein